MDKWIKAEELLKKAINECNIQDEVYTMAHDIIHDHISKIEKEVGLSDDDDNDGTMWYDEIFDDMRSIIYEKIKKWLEE